MSANKTPAQSAKPFDAAKYQAAKEAKEAKSNGATPSKAGSAAPSAAPAVAAGEDPAKAIEQLNIKTKAVYVACLGNGAPWSLTWLKQERQQRRPRGQQPADVQQREAASVGVVEERQAARQVSGDVQGHREVEP